MSRQISALFGGGLLYRRGGDRFEIFRKGIVVRFKLPRLVDELLALRALVDLRFDFGHGLSLADLLACREVRHG